MNISVLCTDRIHPVIASLQRWITDMSSMGHSAVLLYDKTDLQGGDILFLVSCSQLITADERNRYQATLVLHASDLPRGRGWSPHIWAALSNEKEITVTLLEATEPVDSGAIWSKTKFILEGHELLAEINAKLFEAELSLMTMAIEQFGRITPIQQMGDAGQYMRKRTPEDSKLDPNKTIAEQFDVLRVADPLRHPAFLDYRGKRYFIVIKKSPNE